MVIIGLNGSKMTAYPRLKVIYDKLTGFTKQLLFFSFFYLSLIKVL